MIVEPITMAERRDDGTDDGNDGGAGTGLATKKRCRHSTTNSIGVCGVFSYEVAETKVGQVIDFARQNQHPLQCTLEKA